MRQAADTKLCSSRSLTIQLLTNWLVNRECASWLELHISVMWMADMHNHVYGDMITHDMGSCYGFDSLETCLANAVVSKGPAKRYLAIYVLQRAKSHSEKQNLNSKTTALF
jgi:hypothetical protein